MSVRLTDIAHLIEAVLANPACRAELVALACLLASKHTEAVLSIAEQPAPKPTRLLTVEEAAEILHMPVSSVYHHASEWSFTRRPTPHVLRFDEAGLLAWIAGRKS